MIKTVVYSVAVQLNLKNSCSCYNMMHEHVALQLEVERGWRGVIFVLSCGNA